MKILLVATKLGRREVEAARVFGEWAVHEAHDEPPGTWRVTHTVSGRCIPDDMCTGGRRFAVKLAKRLAKERLTLSGVDSFIDPMGTEITGTVPDTYYVVQSLAALTYAEEA